MPSDIGKKIRISVFGESHGEGIGVVIDGLPHGLDIDMDSICVQLSRRMPGKDNTSTPRIELDIPDIKSGVLNNKTTGAPLCALFSNSDTHSSDYEQFIRFPRPSHADYTSMLRYDGYNDIRGSGHFSGRLTAPIVFAGAICRSALAQKGIYIGGHVFQVGNVFDTPFDPVRVGKNELSELSSRYFSVINQKSEKAMRKLIESVRDEGDSIGGVLEVAVCGFPAGIGNPMFEGIENEISRAVFGIPAVKGIEFGAGFGFASMKGSEANDPFVYENFAVKTEKNNNGGILGGISTGMPILFRTCVKPTPSISKQQKTVDLKEKVNSIISIEGRHDPCILPRALPVVEAACAVALINFL